MFSTFGPGSRSEDEGATRATHGSSPPRCVAFSMVVLSGRASRNTSISSAVRLRAPSTTACRSDSAAAAREKDPLRRLVRARNGEEGARALRTSRVHTPCLCLLPRAQHVSALPKLCPSWFQPLTAGALWPVLCGWVTAAERRWIDSRVAQEACCDMSRYTGWRGRLGWCCDMTSSRLRCLPRRLVVAWAAMCSQFSRPICCFLTSPRWRSRGQWLDGLFQLSQATRHTQHSELPKYSWSTSKHLFCHTCLTYTALAPGGPACQPFPCCGSS